MPELFGVSGESEDLGISSPNLTGDFIAGIDQPQSGDGLGITIPWGGGATARTYQEYGPSTIASGNDRLLSDISNYSLSGGTNLTYNLEGLIGPQGPPGPPGAQGLQGVPGTSFANSNFLASLKSTLEYIANEWTNSDTILYADSTDIYWEKTWEKLDVDGTVNSWNEIDMDEDGSFVIIAADAGIFVSTDSGDTWAEKNPDTEDFIAASCSASAGKAVVLGDDNRINGKLWATTDYGANWAEITISE